MPSCPTRSVGNQGWKETQTHSLFPVCCEPPGILGNNLRTTSMACNDIWNPIFLFGVFFYLRTALAHFSSHFQGQASAGWVLGLLSGHRTSQSRAAGPKWHPGPQADSWGKQPLSDRTDPPKRCCFKFPGPRLDARLVWFSGVWW